MEKSKIKFSFIHNHNGDFDMDLFAIDKIWFDSNSGEVTFAKRLFRINAPVWLKRAVFCKEFDW